jgi:pheromone shutdown protein TraB
MTQDGNNKVAWWKVPEIVSKNIFALTGIARGLVSGMYNKLSKAIENDQGGEFKAAIEAAAKDFTAIARGLVSGINDEMSKAIENDRGGEFKAAIEAAKANGASRLVLGDQAFIKTIQRVAELVIKSGDPWGVFNRLNKINKEEMHPFRDKVKLNLRKTKAEHDNKDLRKAVGEALKTDAVFRERLFKRLENEVPEVMQALLKDRDYIMAESIWREIEKGAQHVVGIVGLAHVPGIKNLLMKKTQVVPDNETNE